MFRKKRKAQAKKPLARCPICRKADWVPHCDPVCRANWWKCAVCYASLKPGVLEGEPPTIVKYQPKQEEPDLDEPPADYFPED